MKPITPGSSMISHGFLFDFIFDFKKATSIALVSLISLQSTGVFAAPLPDTLPSGYQVKIGNVSFDNSVANTLNVNSSSSKAVVEYPSFSIGSSATVNFFLPSSSASILNRVTGNSLSEIFGKLWSNGNVFLINPNGVLFGSSSSVNVSGLVASTLNLSNNDFLNANYVFNRLDGKTASSIINNGTINSTKFLGFLAAGISNSGKINSRTVGFGIGDKISLSFGGNVGMEVTVNDALKNKVAGFNSAISNSGLIDSKFTEFESFINKALYSSIVNNSGNIFAEDLINENGSFRLISKSFDPLSNSISLASSISGASFNSGNISADSVSIKTGTLRNTGSINSFSDLSIDLTETSSIQVPLADSTLVHTPAEFPFPQGPSVFVAYDDLFFSLSNPNSPLNQFLDKYPNPQILELANGRVYVVPLTSESLSFGLLNQGNLSAFGDINISSSIGDIVNRNSPSLDASIAAGNDLFLSAPNVINQRAGYRTTLTLDYPFIDGETHDIQYWNDVAPDKNASIIAGDDLVIKADKTVLNSGGEINAGASLNSETEKDPLDSAFDTGVLKITAENFVNSQPILQQTTYDHWKNYKNHEEWHLNSLASPPAFINADNMFIGLDGTFTNTGLIVSKDKFDLGTRQFINGLFGKDSQIINPSNFIPGSISARNINIHGGDDFSLGRFINSGGFIYGEEGVEIKAQKIENIRRTAKKVAKVKEYEGGLFGGSKEKFVTYDEIQAGGIIQSGKEIKISAEESFFNKGGLIKAETDINIEAPLIVNEVQEGSRVVTWDPGWIGKILGLDAWDYASVYAPGQIIAGNDINLTAKSTNNKGTIINRGSDIISTGGDINIKADKLVEQNWVASHHTVSDRAELDGLKIVRDKQTEHVTRGSTIAALDGNVNIEVGNDKTKGTFRNIASDVIAIDNPLTPLPTLETTNADGAITSTPVSAGNISINADTIDISDDVHQSTNIHTEVGIFQAELPGFTQIGYINTETSLSTHQSSNIIGSGNVSITSPASLTGGAQNNGSITVTGSNIVAGNNVSISGDTVTIQAGEYEDTLEQNGFVTETGFGPSNPKGGGITTIWHTNASQENLTPSNIIAGNTLSIDSTSTNIQASNLSAGEKIVLDTENLTISGDWEDANASTDSASLGADIGFTRGPGGMRPGVSVTLTGGNNTSESGNFISSSITAPIIERPNASISGTLINGQGVGMPAETTYSNTESNAVSASVTFGPGYFIPGAAYTNVENGQGYTVGMSTAGPSGGLINGPWSIGGSLSRPTDSLSTAFSPYIYNSDLDFGVSFTLGQTQGQSNHWFTSSNLLTPIGNIGATFQQGNLIGTTFGPYTQLNNPFNYTCFPKGTGIRTRKRRKDGSYEEFDLEIEKIETGDEVLSFNESTQELEWKLVEETFVRRKDKVFRITLLDGTVISPTEEHPFWVGGTWIAAKNLKIGDSLLNKDLEEVQILSIEEEAFESAIEVYNFRVQDNHNYFAQGVLVHNTYDPLLMNESNKLSNTATLQSQPIPNPVSNTPTPVFNIEITNNSPYIQTLNDLIAITRVNSNLAPDQRVFYSSKLNELKNNLLNASNTEGVIDLQATVQRILLDIHLAQANKVLEEDFITQEAIKNLNAAQDTIKEIKKKINDKELEKSLDEISNKVFWQSAVIQGVGWLKPLEKALDKWGVLHNIEENVLKEFKEVAKLNALSNSEGKEIFDSSRVRELLSKNLLSDNDLKEIQNYEIDKRKEISEQAKNNENKLKQIITDSRDHSNHPREEIKNRIQDFIEDESQIAKSLEKQLAFLKQNKRILPENVYYAEVDRIAYQAANQIIDASRLDDFVVNLDNGLYNKNNSARNTLAKIYTQASKEGINHVNEMNEYLYPNLEIPKIPNGMTYFGNFLSPGTNGHWVNSPYQSDPGRVHPVFHTDAFHGGMDMTFAEGTKVKSTISGYVIASQSMKGYGNIIDIGNPETGEIIRFAHLSSIDKKIGDKVKLGDIVASSGHTGVGSGPHLHYEVLKDTFSINLENNKIIYTPKGSGSKNPPEIDPRWGQLTTDRRTK